MSQRAPNAWLEHADGRKYPIEGAISIGRAERLNTYGIAHDKISRQHALLHTQVSGEIWLVDVGSTNGTYVNGDRIVFPTRLRDNDTVNFGRGVEFIFRQPISAEERRANTLMQKTAADVHQERRWMLVADIESFTSLSKSCSAAELSQLVGGWLGSCTTLIERNGGRVNKYTGDGFLAFWRDLPGSDKAVAEALREFVALREASHVPFRVVLHVGIVAIGGAPSLGEESLISDDLSLTFRMEKLAGALAVPFLISSAARKDLDGMVGFEPVSGSHEVKGFGSVENLWTVGMPGR